MTKALPRRQDGRPAPNDSAIKKKRCAYVSVLHKHLSSRNNEYFFFLFWRAWGIGEWRAPLWRQGTACIWLCGRAPEGDAGRLRKRGTRINKLITHIHPPVTRIHKCINAYIYNYTYSISPCTNTLDLSVFVCTYVQVYVYDYGGATD